MYQSFAYLVHLSLAQFSHLLILQASHSYFLSKGSQDLSMGTTNTPNAHFGSGSQLNLSVGIYFGWHFGKGSESTFSIGFYPYSNYGYFLKDTIPSLLFLPSLGLCLHLAQSSLLFFLAALGI